MVQSVKGQPTVSVDGEVASIQDSNSMEERGSIRSGLDRFAEWFCGEICEIYVVVFNESCSQKWVKDVVVM